MRWQLQYCRFWLSAVTSQDFQSLLQIWFIMMMKYEAREEEALLNNELEGILHAHKGSRFMNAPAFFLISAGAFIVSLVVSAPGILPPHWITMKSHTTLCDDQWLQVQNHLVRLDPGDEVPESTELCDWYRLTAKHHGAFATTCTRFYKMQGESLKYMHNVYGTLLVEVHRLREKMRPRASGGPIDYRNVIQEEDNDGFLDNGTRLQRLQESARWRLQLAMAGHSYAWMLRTAETGDTSESGSGSWVGDDVSFRGHTGYTSDDDHWASGR